MMNANLKNRLINHKISESVWVQSSRSESSIAFNKQLNKTLEKLKLEDKTIGKRHHNRHEYFNKKVL